MKTEMINIGEFRSNISTLWKRAKERKIRYVVLVYGKPAFTVTPIYDNKIPDIK